MFTYSLLSHKLNFLLGVEAKAAPSRGNYVRQSEISGMNDMSPVSLEAGIFPAKKTCQQDSGVFRFARALTPHFGDEAGTFPATVYISELSSLLRLRSTFTLV